MVALGMATVFVNWYLSITSPTSSWGSFDVLSVFGGGVLHIYEVCGGLSS